MRDDHCGIYILFHKENNLKIGETKYRYTNNKESK